MNSTYISRSNLNGPQIILKFNVCVRLFKQNLTCDQTLNLLLLLLLKGKIYFI